MKRMRIAHFGWLLVVLVVGGALRLGYVWWLPGQGRDLLHSDMWVYDTSAWKMCTGEPLPEHYGFNGYHPLSASTYYYAGYTYFVAGIYALFGHDPAAVRVVQGVIGTATIALVYVVALVVFGRRPAIVAAALTALYLPLVYYAGLLLTETWFVFLQMAALALWLAAWRREGKANGGRAGFGAVRVLLAIAAGLFAGLACLNRAAFLPAIAVLALGGIVAPPISVSKGQRWTLGAAFVGAALAAIAPVTWRNYQIHGRLILVSSNGPSTFYVGHVTHTPFQPDDLPEGVSDAEAAAIYKRRSFDYLQRHWQTYLAEIPEYFHAIWLGSDFWPNATTYWLYTDALDRGRPPRRIRRVVDEPAGPPFGRMTHFPDLMRYADAVLWLILGLPLSLLAVFFLPRENRRWIFLYLVLVPYVLIPFLAPPFPRYRIPAVPLLFILAGQTVCVLWQCRRRWREERPSSAPPSGKME
jgi:4-amino-4-deoxy-L-arabinose transferase-like glycosyltransferase